MKKNFLSYLLVAVFLLALSLVCDLLLLKYQLYENEVPVATTFVTPTKKAVLIYAHDDDYISAAGTIALLRMQGFRISYLCMTNHNHKGEAQIRREEMKQVAERVGLDRLVLHPESFLQRDPALLSSYHIVPASMFGTVYHLDSLRSVIHSFLREEQPSIIFTLDDQIGGYGHPDHIVVSRLITEVCENMLKEGLMTDPPVILQNVFHEAHEQYLMADVQIYEDAKKTYATDGMPAPTIAFDVQHLTGFKLSLIRTHRSQHRNISKFLPGYDLYPSDLYGWLYPKEYFRMIEPGGKAGGGNISAAAPVVWHHHGQRP